MLNKHNLTIITGVFLLIVASTATPAAAMSNNTDAAVAPDTTPSSENGDYQANTAKYITHHLIVLPSKHKQENNSYNTTVAKIESVDGVTVTDEYSKENKLIAAIDTRVQSVDAIRDSAEIKRINSQIRYEPSPPDEKDNTVSTQEVIPPQPPTDQEYTWGLKRLNVPEAWEKFDVKGEGMKVAVLDSGVDPSHPDIDLAGDPSDNYKGGWLDIIGNFYNDKKRLAEGEEAKAPYDSLPGGHGTHVAGTVAGGDSTGVHIGVAPKAEIMAVNIYNNEGNYVTPDYVARGMYWAKNNNADVISVSGGNGLRFGQPSPYRMKAVRDAQDANIPVIVATGNFGPNTTSDLAGQQASISVGNMWEQNEMVSLSSGKRFDPSKYYTGEINPIVDVPEDHLIDSWDINRWENPKINPYVVAPGAGVWSADNGTNTLEEKTGTSMATPHISGLALLAYQNNPSLTEQEFRTALKASASYLPNQPNQRNARQGYGVPDAVKLLKYSDKGGYITPKSISTNESVTPGETVHISTTIANENIVGDATQSNISLYVNGNKAKTIASDVIIPSESQEQFSTTYNTTTTSTNLNVTVKTQDSRKSTIAEVKELTTPTAAFDYTPQTPTTGEKITFNGSQSSMGDSNITTYEWDFNGDASIDKTGEDVTHTFEAAGNYTVDLTVVDEEGNTSVATKTIRVAEGVSLHNVSITPSKVGENKSSHTLSFEAHSVSTDGKEDTFSITIPQKVTLHSINYVAFKQNDGTETSIAYKTQDNTIDFAVNKTGAEYATDIDIKTNMTLSAPEQTP